MVEPLDSPPMDHGSDRYGYIEYSGAPDGVAPPESLVDKAMRDACEDCNPNLFFRWVRARVWHLTVAHDDGCPHLAKIQRDQELLDDGD